jgi:hypothetical protein
MPPPQGETDGDAPADVAKAPSVVGIDQNVEALVRHGFSRCKARIAVPWAGEAIGVYK